MSNGKRRSSAVVSFSSEAPSWRLELSPAYSRLLPTVANTADAIESVYYNIGIVAQWTLKSALCVL